MRTKFVNWITAFIFVSLGLGVFRLSVVQAKSFRRLSDKNCIRLLSQEGSRGRILDRNGEVIVGNTLSYDVMVLPSDDVQEEELLLQIARVLGSDPAKLRQTLRGSFVASSVPAVVARNIETKQAIALEELRSDLGGLMIQPHPVRDYPHGDIACHVIGYLSEIDHWRLTKLEDYGYKTKDLVGFGGIEEKYDYYLRQEEGGLSVEVDHRGRFVRVLGFRPPKNGKDIQLTLDVGVQKIAEDFLGPRRGSVVIMDPANGEVIAMANGPGFSPQAFVKRSQRYLIEDYFSDPAAPLVNRAITGLYPAASVFKLVVAAAGLETRKIRPETSFSCPGGMKIGNRWFACWDTHGQQNLQQGIIHSCDVFFYHAGLAVGPEKIHEFALRFGLARPTGIELPYESSGFLPHPLWKKISQLKNWYDGDTANFSIGQGEVLVTPLQLARMTAVFANSGVMVTPHIVRAVDGKEVAFYPRKSARVAVKDDTFQQIRKAMRDTVAWESGTASTLSGLPVSVAGKTGTAQVSRGQPHGWFAGFFPYNKPKYAICVFLEHGGSGQASCVLARDIIRAMVDAGLVDS